jgi:DNA-binding transcriptional regulator LsrR (DeoR family)
MPSAPKTLPLPAEFGGDLTVAATWLYYAEALTQAEIAVALGVSRASVANYLAEARRRGLVSVRLSPDLLDQGRLGERLRAQFGLKAAYIAPIGPEAGDSARFRVKLGIAGGHVLSALLAPNSILGVAWGRTVLELAAALPEQTLPDLRVVQVSGSSLGDERTSPESCTLLIARRLGAGYHNFHAPAVVTSPALREALLAEPPLVRHFERVRACDIVLFGVGEVALSARWADSEALIRPALGEYLGKGAAAILIGRFLDEKGAEIEGPLSGRMIGMELSDLARVPTRLCVAGGTEKLAAIRAALRGGYVTHLVTDMLTAEALLEEGR